MRDEISLPEPTLRLFARVRAAALAVFVLGLCAAARCAPRPLALDAHEQPISCHD